jgi:hypothetical protein
MDSYIVSVIYIKIHFQVIFCLPAVNSESFHAAVKVAAVNAHQFGGAADVAVRLREFYENVFAFICLSGLAVGIEVIARGWCDRREQMCRRGCAC